jgi:ribosome biogenesis GTPase A
MSGIVNPINWFPGHMSKTRRGISNALKQVDVVVEIIDARIPVSSRNPEIDKILGNKKRIILMNKYDIADVTETKKWINYFENNGFQALGVDCKTGKGLERFIPKTRELLKEEIEKWAVKGMKNKSIRAVVVGIPNVGKSSFINRMAKNSKAKVEDKPGVTKKNQWYYIGKDFYLLDTPGVLWPKFEDQNVAKNLAFTGAIKDQIIDIEEICEDLLLTLFLKDRYCILERYKLNKKKVLDYIEFKAENNGMPYDQNGNLIETILEMVGRSRGILKARGEIDTYRVANTVLNEFRSGNLTKITLETIN